MLAFDERQAFPGRSERRAVVACVQLAAESRAPPGLAAERGKKRGRSLRPITGFSWGEAPTNLAQSHARISSLFGRKVFCSNVSSCNHFR